jgi:hypothetical protein
MNDPDSQISGSKKIHFVGVGKLDRLNRSKRSDVTITINFKPTSIERKNRKSGGTHTYERQRNPIEMNIKGESRYGFTSEGKGIFGVKPQPYKFWKLLEWGGSMYEPQSSKDQRVKLTPGQGMIESIEIKSVSGGRDSVLQPGGDSIYFMTDKPEWWAKFGATTDEPEMIKGLKSFSKALKKNNSYINRRIDRAIEESLR